MWSKESRIGDMCDVLLASNPFTPNGNPSGVANSASDVMKAKGVALRLRTKVPQMPHFLCIFGKGCPGAKGWQALAFKVFHNLELAVLVRLVFEGEFANLLIY